jgi:sarcosine oxidase, subunit beta
MRERYLTALPHTAELVVVGGGIVGTATAFHAARAGIRPLILERRPRLCTLTTPVSTGAFRLQFDNEEELTLIRESVDLFLNFADRTEQADYDPRVRAQGYLWLTTSPRRASAHRDLVAQQHAWGQTDVELLDGDEARYRFPHISPEVVSARFRAGDGFLDPKEVALGFADAARADVLTNCAVTGFRVEGGRLAGVQTDRGEIATRNAVIAAGPFLGPVSATAKLDLPVTTVRRQKVVFPQSFAVPAHAPMTIDDDTGAHWRPALNGGAYLLFTDPNTPPSPPADDVPLDHRFAFELLDPDSHVSVSRVTPFWRDIWHRGAANWMVQAGQYTMTPDHRPLIGQSAIEGLYINGGYSGHGIMGSPAGSRILIDVLRGSLPAAENPFRPDRQFVARHMDVL